MAFRSIRLHGPHQANTPCGLPATTKSTLLDISLIYPFKFASRPFACIRCGRRFTELAIPQAATRAQAGLSEGPTGPAGTTKSACFPEFVNGAGTTWDRRGTGGWWSGRGSNPRPSHCERDALPAELPPHARRAILASRSGRSNQVLTAHAGCGYDPSGAAGVRGPETRHAGHGRASTGVYAAGSGRAECVAEHPAAPRPADPVFLSGGLHSGVHARGLRDP